MPCLVEFAQLVLEKEILKSRPIYFRYILLSPLEKELGPLFKKKLNSPYSLSHENGEYLQTKRRRTTFDQKNSRELSDHMSLN